MPSVLLVNVTRLGLVVAMLLGLSRPALALPNPSPLRFTAPTPGAGSLVTTGAVNIRLEAPCSFDEGSLAVSLNGGPLPTASFLPFSPCSNGRKTSKTVAIGVTLPNGTIATAPTILEAGSQGDFSGNGSGDALAWNFDGAAAPATGSAVSATFPAAGTFTVRLRATNTQTLAASGLDEGSLISAQLAFKGGDPTPDSREVAVRIAADVDSRNYESSHVHPITLSASGNQLYAVNTPEGRLAIFDVAGDGSLGFVGDVPVGLDPVSLAVRPGTNEVWVANHLSDSVSVVDVAARKLVATIAVGDEPTDVAFASGRGFVLCAGNQDRLRVYNPATRTQIAAIDLLADEPRALATNAAGTEVYAVPLESGNRSTTLFHDLVTAGGGPPPPNPPRLPGLGTAPATGLIVQFDPVSGQWRDDAGDDWSTFVDFTLPDNDVFVIDADAGTPSIIRTVSGVGTILYDVAVHPTTGELWVPNTDARNLVRFEPNLRGHLVQTRITRVNPDTGTVTAHVDLNPHINYAVTPGSPAEIADSLSQPGDGVFTADGSHYYLAAFGSGKVGVLDASGAVTARIPVGGGPSGVALKESASRLYVMNRFENTISVVNTATNTEIGFIGVAGPSAFDPSPDVIKEGRRFLYDARLTSGHGDVACATCHVFGNFDNLAWDLGNPQGAFVPFSSTPWVTFAPLGPSTTGFDPMKGPMTTQTLRGLDTLEPFHWRGDRQNFQHFNQAFVGLMGMNGTCSVSGGFCTETADCPSGQLCLGLSTADIDAYADFIMTVNFPPNPFQNLDGTLPTSVPVPLQTGGGATTNANAANGSTIFSSLNLDGGVFACALCHELPAGTSRNLFNGQLEVESQDFKIPHLRNMYEKVGFNVIRPGLQSGDANNIGTAIQKHGFGFIHDGSLSLTEFLAAGVFTMNASQERDMFAFMLAFPTESPPAIGRQETVTSANKNDAGVVSTIATLIAQAQAAKADLIAKGVVGGVAKGWVYDRTQDALVPDSLIEPPLTESELRAAIGGADVVTFTGVPPGAGVRLGIDRDRDTWLDRTEVFLGTDPADPNSNPWQWQP
jgi:YVTN family beta-propeller protein